MTKEIPILFSTPMVQAILEGQKTMTRRIIKPQAPEAHRFIGSNYDSEKNKTGFYWSDNTEGDMQGFWPGTFENLYCRYGQPGDVLWVRETHMYVGKTNIEYIYKCGYPQNLHPDIINIPSAKCIGWKPSIHMPKAAARIWLQVEEIRVERLQDITEEDAIAEGVLRYVNSQNKTKFLNYLPAKPGHVKREKHFGHGYMYSESESAKYSFKTLWIKINGTESYDLNPWVWVVKFKVLSTTGKPQVCYKTNEICKYDCKGLCRESM